MVIGVNARLLLPHRMEGIARYCWETTKRMILNNPKDHFVLFFDRAVDPLFRIADNVTCVSVFPQARHPLLWKWWFDFSLPRQFKKHKIDVFYSADGFLSMRTDIPTLLVSHDIAYFHYPLSMKKGHLSYYQKQVPRFHTKADHIISVSQATKTDLVEHLGLDPSKITIAYNALPLRDYSGLSPKKKEFFLYLGSLHPRKNLVNLLLAFDGFIESLKESGYRSALPKLKIAGRAAFGTSGIDKAHASMNNGQLVAFLGSVTEDQKWSLLAEAKIMCYISKWEGFGIPLLEAMSARTPVITSNRGALKEVAGDAALLVSPENIKEIKDNMMLLWNDEDLRKKLVVRGNKRVTEFDWEKSSELIYRALENIAR